MKEYDTRSIRNVALIAHGGTGKTSLTEAMLFESGAIARMGRVEEGTTTSDFDPDEVKRKISVNLSVLPCEWKGVKVNLIDTPGYADFIGEEKCGVRAADAALIVVDAAAGVQVGTEIAWECADDAGSPRAFFVNRIDRENADFDAAVTKIREIFGNKCVPIQLPIGAQERFTGIVDLIAMKAFMGDKASEASIPEDLAQTALQYREQMIEAIAEADDDVINKYLEGEELSEEEISRALRSCGSTRYRVPDHGWLGGTKCRRRLPARRDREELRIACRSADARGEEAVRRRGAANCRPGRAAGGARIQDDCRSVRRPVDILSRVLGRYAQ